MRTRELYGNVLNYARPRGRLLKSQGLAEALRNMFACDCTKTALILVHSIVTALLSRHSALPATTMPSRVRGFPAWKQGFARPNCRALRALNEVRCVRTDQMCLR